MTERPILFNAPMVRAILAGTKTQTRRVFKEAKLYWRRMSPEEWMAATPNRPAIGGHPKPPKFPALFWDGHGGVAYPCPHGAPGDRLWVRETFCDDWEVTDGVYYRADAASLPIEMFDAGCKWHPSIFMPRKHSRITLEVTEVRVEPVQEITEGDALAEGIQHIGMGIHVGNTQPHIRPVKAFRDLWDSINAKRGYGWDVDPWVWCISFKRIKP